MTFVHILNYKIQTPSNYLNKGADHFHHLLFIDNWYK